LSIIVKPHTVNYYLLAITLSGLFLLALIGFHMIHEIGEVENAFLKSHSDNSKHELQRAVNETLSSANKLADNIAQWDETSQQISDPTYYVYWKKNRLRDVKRIPSYVSEIELYRLNKKTLIVPTNSSLPDTVPDILTFVRTDNNMPFLCVFRPIFIHDSSKEIFGYVGLKIDFLKAMLDLNLFSHNDVTSMIFKNSNTVNPRIIPEDIVNHIQTSELHRNELDQLKNVIYVTFAYTAGLVFLLLAILYWLVLVLFAKPLSQLDQYIRTFKNDKTQEQLPDLNKHFFVYEISNLARSFQDYHLRLEQYQNNLKQLNNELEDRVRHRTRELESTNKELEAFSYSVSHDLRAPLRTIDGFSQVILDDYGQILDDSGKDYLSRVRNSAQHMAKLIDDLLNLSRITRTEFRKSLVNLSSLANSKKDQLLEKLGGKAVPKGKEPEGKKVEVKDIKAEAQTAPKTKAGPQVQ